MAGEKFSLSPEDLRIVVDCPYCLLNNTEPNPDHAGALGTFVHPNAIIGQQVLAPFIENAQLLQEIGTAPKDLIELALGHAAVRDNNGEFVRVSPDELTEAVSTFNESAALSEHSLTPSGEGRGFGSAPFIYTDPNSDSESLSGQAATSVESDNEDEEWKNNIRVGQKLMQLRDSRGFQLQEIASRAGIRVSYLQQVENGKIKPPPGIYSSIIKALAS